MYDGWFDSHFSKILRCKITKNIAHTQDFYKKNNRALAAKKYKHKKREPKQT
jgi:hypothetical protein